MPIEREDDRARQMAEHAGPGVPTLFVLAHLPGLESSRNLRVTARYAFQMPAPTTAAPMAPTIKRPSGRSRIQDVAVSSSEPLRIGSAHDHHRQHGEARVEESLAESLARLASPTASSLRSYRQRLREAPVRSPRNRRRSPGSASSRTARRRRHRARPAGRRARHLPQPPPGWRGSRRGRRTRPWRRDRSGLHLPPRLRAPPAELRRACWRLSPPSVRPNLCENDACDRRAERVDLRLGPHAGLRARAPFLRRDARAREQPWLLDEFDDQTSPSACGSPRRTESPFEPNTAGIALRVCRRQELTRAALRRPVSGSRARRSTRASATWRSSTTPTETCPPSSTGGTRDDRAGLWLRPRLRSACWPSGVGGRPLGTCLLVRAQGRCDRAWSSSRRRELRVRRRGGDVARLPPLAAESLGERPQADADGRVPEPVRARPGPRRLRPLSPRSDDQAVGQCDRQRGSQHRRQLGPLPRRTARPHAALCVHLPVWGLTEITAGDQARFFYRIETYVLAPPRVRATCSRTSSPRSGGDPSGEVPAG